MAGRIGLSEHRAGEIALAMSEAAPNTTRHTVAGVIVLRVVRTDSKPGRVPGRGQRAGDGRRGRCHARRPLHHRHAGHGLGMIARLADTFDPHAASGHGTVLPARFWPRDARRGIPATSGEPPRSVVGGGTRPHQRRAGVRGLLSNTLGPHRADSARVSPAPRGARYPTAHPGADCARLRHARSRSADGCP
ncbi:ATP-binding protein [Streptomyces sp. NBC_01497]|uniref:ATP-binding protein n=1 Tax=Streptomyces sp. NBC_01497 TaxID=2903885 RepID=UPI003FCE7B43